MRNSKLLVTGLVFLAVGISVTLSCSRAQSEEKSYSGIAEALRDWKSEDHGWLSETATRYLLEELSLDWPFTRRPAAVAWHDVRAYASEDGRYCLLVGARSNEWGQGGTASYCMIDFTGRIYWKREGRIEAPPRVSKEGVAALIYADVGTSCATRTSPVRMDFIDISGDVLGSVRWGDRVLRTFQHRFLEEVVGFSRDGRLLLATMNQSWDYQPRQGEWLNSTFLYCIRTDGSEAWRHDLEGFWPRKMEFREAPERMILTGEWRERIDLSVPFDLGFMVFDLEGNLLEKTVTQHVEAFVETE
jgi:hypothetical protein